MNDRNVGPVIGDLLARPMVARLLRYSSVSVVSVVITQSLLALFHNGLGFGPTTANVLAVSIAAVPAYFLNRSWVWARTGAHHLWREVVPFWTYALLGLIVSTVVVTVVTDAWGAGVAAAVANFGAFLVLWVLKFVFLDRIVFGALSRAEDHIGAPAS